MAKLQNEVILIGPGSANTNQADASAIFASTSPVVAWSSLVSYSVDNCVEYGGNIYRSLVGSNLGNTPPTPPAISSDWVLTHENTHDGDLCVVVNGSSSGLSQRISGTWESLNGQPNVVSLVDGQVSPANAFTYNAINFTRARINYSIQRGTGQGWGREGVLYVLNDTAGTVNFSEEDAEIGPDAQVYFSFTQTGSVVNVQYTSASLAVPITLKYTLTGWN